MGEIEKISARDISTIIHRLEIGSPGIHLIGIDGRPRAGPVIKP